MVNLEIGNGSVVSGVFEDIDWGDALYFLQIEMDENGETNYQLMGTSQMVSVPHALHSKTASIAKGLILTDEYGQEYTVSLDPNGNLTADLMMECGDTIIDIRDGQQYITVLIGSQCWMAENLNIGVFTPTVIAQFPHSDVSDNDTIEKYCFDNDPAYCDIYGGLYEWNEVMEYTTIEGTQGICPADWHIPTDYEWKILEGIVDSLYKIGNPHWDELIWRGYDAGKNLKTESGWFDGGNGVNLYGFIALPAGHRGSEGYTMGLSYNTGFWSSTYIAWFRQLSHDSHQIFRNSNNNHFGWSVRCIKDYTNQPPTQPSNSTPGDGSIDIGIDTVLSWACTDPDGNDLFYKIYFGTDPNPAYDTAGIIDTIYDPGILNYNTTYYWKVVAFDSYGDSAVSNIWSFTTGTVSVFTCGDVLVDVRDGQSYNTVQIGTQCWLAENINIGTRIDGTVEQTQNSPTEIIEKYCYDDLESNCDTWGGMYQWDETMQYTSTEGVQGICPTDWHLPTDEEWKQLEGYADSNYGYPDTEWDGTGLRGFDAGKNLKSISGWEGFDNGTDLYGFTALPGGYRATNGIFNNAGFYGYTWSSTEGNSTNAWSRKLLYDNAPTGYMVDRSNDVKGLGFSVRCLMD